MQKKPRFPIQNPRLSHDPVGVQNILAAALKKYGLDKKIAKYNFVLNWPEIVGEEVAKRTKPQGIRDQALFVTVTDSSWAQELSFYKEAILSRLQQFMQNDLQSNSKDKVIVNDIFFVVGDLK